ncbi:MAG TPA: hypothetical protein VII51_07025 [Gaiellaceae bacterium]
MNVLTGDSERDRPGRPAAWELDPPPTAAPEEERSRLLEYVVLRATGVLLAVLVLGHFAVTHLVTDVAHDNSAFVARRLSSGLWIAWDSTMLGAALVHGVTGLRIATADYLLDTRARRIAEVSILALGAVLLVIGSLAIGRAAVA